MKRLSSIRIFGRKALREQIESQDVLLLEKFKSVCEGCGSYSIINNPRAAQERGAIQGVIQNSKSMNEQKQVLSRIHAILDKAIADRVSSVNSLEYATPDSASNEDSTISSIKEYLRLQLLKEYLSRLKQCIADEEFPESRLTNTALSRLVDAVLVGTPSERISEHIRLLYGDSVDQQQVRCSLYSLYEPEVSVCLSTFLLLKSDWLPAYHKKTLPKFIKSYLLDTIELNTKARCVFSWADPNFSGFQPLPDETVMKTNSVLESRRLYFKEGESLISEIVSAYTGTIRMRYENKREWRATIRNGILFFFGTCVLDYIVCVI